MTKIKITIKLPSKNIAIFLIDGGCMGYGGRNFAQDLNKYQAIIKDVNGDLSEYQIKNILVSCGYPAYQRPQSLVGDWKPIASCHYPAIQYVNNEVPGLYEWITVIPHYQYGYKPHILHYSSGSESLVSNEQLEFYLWFESIYPELEMIRLEVNFDNRKYVGDRLYRLLKSQTVNLLQITFLNTYFGNYSIFKQILKDTGLCLKCFKPGLPQMGLGIIRIFNNFMIRHMQGKEWAKHESQRKDYVIIDIYGKFVTVDGAGNLSLTINRQDSGAHIPLDKYNRKEFCLGKDRCVCKSQS